MAYEVFKYEKEFVLESGIILPGFHLAYTTHGKLNEEKNNVVWIFHALTANSDCIEWWPGLAGPGKLFDPSEYFIVCVNMPGSCYGSFGPLDVNPANSEVYYHSFPFFTTRDMIRSYRELRDALDIQKVSIGIGGSMGGQQLLEWSIEEPSFFEFIFPLATNAFHSPWAVAINASQRHAIEVDVSWKERNEKAGLRGMMVAREIALISYRHYDTYNINQSEVTNDNIEHFKSDSYQKYQGEKLARRFNAFSYYLLSKSMDAHNVGRGRNGVQQALKRIEARTLVIGISSDNLFPLREQEFLASHIPNAKLKVINSQFGHDGFLLEYQQIQDAIKDFLDRHEAEYRRLETPDDVVQNKAVTK